MKFITSQQQLQKIYDESIDSVRRRKPVYRITKLFAWLPIYNSLETVWLEEVYIDQELKEVEGFFFNKYLAWVNIKFSTKEKYEQYLKDVTNGK